MHPILEQSFRDMIVCPLCKTPITWQDTECACDACGQHFPQLAQGVWSFMLTPPSFLASSPQLSWARGQSQYEIWDRHESKRDEYALYLAEIDSVREIYTDIFKLIGSVLDVGGHQGRLRHFLPPEARYLSVDPYVMVFNGLEHLPNLLRAYPCLRQPCNFIQAQAEHLPIRAGTFDYVHMRSVLDHFFDPYVALLEARRVLRAGGGALIGLFVTGESPISKGTGPAVLISRVRKKLRDEGVLATAQATLRRLVGRTVRDEHMWHPTYDELAALIQSAGFEIEHVHWQKPPFDHVVYLMARKR